MNINKTIVYLILMSPITTLLQGLSGFSNINKVFLGLLVVLLFFMCVKKMYKIDFILILFALIVWINSFINVNSSFLNINDLVYFWMWIFLFIYLKNNFSRFECYIRTEIQFVKWVIIIWSILVIVSIKYTNAYYYEWGTSVYFKSFADNSFRFAATCLFVTVLIGLYVNMLDKKKYLIGLVVPLVGVAASGSRTYLGLVLVLITLILYKNINKNLFFLLLVPIFAILLYIISNSNMMDKFQYVENVGKMNNKNWIETITSGRTVFWNYDMKAFVNSGVLHMLIGNSVTFSYEVSSAYFENAIQAHNDFLNILLSYGFLGLYVYVSVLFRFCKTIVNDYVRIDKKYIGVFALIYFTNAFMNGVFTYLSATLSLPLILIMFSNKERNKYD